MAGTPEKDTFDPLKNYVQVEFIEQRAPCDFELNETQDILRYDEEQDKEHVFGTGAIGDSFQILEGINTNEFSIRKGTFYWRGQALRVHEDVLVSGLATPPANSTYTVYCDFYQEQIDSTVDPDIISPSIGAETAVRQKRTVEFGYVIDAPVPSPAAGTTRFQIGQIQRLAGNPNITAAMIQDHRQEQRATYVRSGGRHYVSSGLDFVLREVLTRVGGTYFTVLDSLITMPASSALYFWVDDTGALQNGIVLPAEGFYCPLVYVATDATDITALIDWRMFASPYQVVEDDIGEARGPFDDFSDAWSVGHNPDGTHKPAATVAGDIYKSDIYDFKVIETTPNTLSVYVNPGLDVRVDGYGPVEWAGGVVGPLVPPATDKRIDLIVLTNDGSVLVEQSTIVSDPPAVPPYPQDKQVLAYVEIHAGDVTLDQSRITDAREWLNSKNGLSLTKGSRHVFPFSSAFQPHEVPVVAGAGWTTYTHNLGCKPTVFVLDAAGL